MKLVITEILAIQRALNALWEEYVQFKCPKSIKLDLDKYHKWCEIEERDRMSELYQIQQLRKKLTEEVNRQLKADKHKPA